MSKYLFSCLLLPHLGITGFSLWLTLHSPTLFNIIVSINMCLLLLLINMSAAEEWRQL
jgi:hypothetical protein